MTEQVTSLTEADHLLTLLGEQYKQLYEIAQETICNLGKEQAGYFTRLANDWMDVLGAIIDTYSENERFHSLMYFYLSSLFKEVSWFQLLFLGGNYPLLLRSLRFIWEMMFRAYCVDTCACESCGDSELPGSTIDDKLEWLAQNERNMFQWKKFMRSVLLQLLPQAEGTEMEEYYRSLWGKLNAYVHPSKTLLDRMFVGASGFLVRDAFDKEWALETIGTATMVFDLVWLAVISRFPGCEELLAQKGLHLEYPTVTIALEGFSAIEP